MKSSLYVRFWTDNDDEVIEQRMRSLSCSYDEATVMDADDAFVGTNQSLGDIDHLGVGLVVGVVVDG